MGNYRCSTGVEPIRSKDVLSHRGSAGEASRGGLEMIHSKRTSRMPLLQSRNLLVPCWSHGSGIEPSVQRCPVPAGACAQSAAAATATAVAAISAPIAHCQFCVTQARPGLRSRACASVIQSQPAAVGDFTNISSGPSPSSAGM